MKIRACFENWLPYYALTSEGTHTGPVFEVVQKIATDIDATVQFIELPYKRCLDEVRSGRIDMILLSSPGIDGIIESQTPLAYWTLMAVVHKNSAKTTYSNMRQFAGKNVGTFAGYQYPSVISDGRASWASEVKITYNEKTDGDRLRIFRLIERGRIDVAFLDLAWVHTILAKTKLDVQLLHPSVYSDPSMIGYAPTSSNISLLFENELAKIAKSGELDSLYKARLGIPLSAF